MRELKFRAWDKEAEEYRNGYEVLLTYDGSAISRYVLGALNTDMPVNVIIERYTGLKDKNGKEIYEGDIIQEEIDTGDDLLDGIHEYTVVWNKDCLCWGLEGAGFRNDLYEVNRTAEIVGNIHEIPELLGGEE